MKILFVIVAILALVSVSNAYTTYTYHNGDEILRKLQLLDDNTYVLFFYNDPGHNRDLRTTNDYYKDRLRTDVLAPKQDDATFYYAEIDATDKYGNGYLVDRLGVDRKVLLEKPIVVVMKKGVGNVIYGPTAINSIKDSLKKLEGGAPAK